MYDDRRENAKIDWRRPFQTMIRFTKRTAHRRINGILLVLVYHVPTEITIAATGDRTWDRHRGDLLQRMFHLRIRRLTLPSGRVNREVLQVNDLFHSPLQRFIALLP